MAEIPFTQYMRPDGRKRQIWVEVSDDVCRKARELVAAGYVFEAEVLRGDALVSLTISDREEDYVIEVVRNGPGVLAHVEDMITKFRIEPGLPKDPHEPTALLELWHAHENPL